MNIKEEIIEYLKKKDWEPFQIAYYIYLKSCEIFSYNMRYLYDDKNKENIYQTRININEVNQFEIVCSTWCFFMKDMLNLFGINVNIVKGNKTHVFVMVEIPPYKIKMDAMELGHDLTRVKLGNTTTGFIDINKNDDFEIKLTQYDQEIRKDKMTYLSKGFAKLQKKLQEQNYFQNTQLNSTFSNEMFIEKLDLIKELINHTSKFQKYSDTFYYLNYLKFKLLTKLEQSRIHDYPFWKFYNDQKWEILHLILLDSYEAPAICYRMSKEQNTYEMQQIPKEEMIYYVDNYEGKIKGIYRVLDVI